MTEAINVLTGRPYSTNSANSVNPSPSPPSPNRRSSSGVVHEVNYKCRTNGKPIPMKYYLTDWERRDVIKDAGEAGCLVLEYYLRKAAINESGISDEEVAYHFGWPKQKAKRYRLKLIRHGWFSSLKYKTSKGRKAVTYYVGKEAVKDSKRSGDLTLSKAPNVVQALRGLRFRTPHAS